MLADGATSTAIRTERSGGLVVQDAHGRLAEAAQRGNLFSAHAINTAMVIYTTAAGTGGPLIWNGSNNKVVSVLAAGFGIATTASGVAGAVGIATGIGQLSAPSSTTAIDSSGNMYVGGAVSQATPYRVGTTTNAASRFIPFVQVSTGAVSIADTTINWFWFDGAVLAPPNTFVTLAASATLTSAVSNSFIIWEELPL
jgi:hypothetical protein